MRTRSAAVFALTLTLLAACGSDASSDDASSTSASVAAATASAAEAATPAAARQTFVGEIADTNAFVAVIAEGDKAWAYFCDGEGKPTDSIFSYLGGTIAGAKISVTGDDGEALSGDVVGEAVTGTVTLPDGTSKPFSAAKAVGDAGWFSATASTATVDEVGSWIRLDDGRVRGKVVATTQGSGGSGVEPTDPAQLGGAGTVPPTAEPTPTGLFKCIRATRAFNKAMEVRDEAFHNGTDEELNAAVDAASAALDARRAACA